MSHESVRTFQSAGVLEDLLPYLNFDGKKVSGDPVTASAQYVVGCDGASSLVRSLMDTEVTDTGFSSSWLVIDTLLRPGATPLGLFGHVLDPARPATLAPAGTNRQRFEFMVVDGDDPAHIVDPDSVWRLIGRWGATPENVELKRSAIYTFRGRWADTWRDGRVLLAGDAAHQTPPFLGQGFNSGVRDTIALAWRIDLILGGTAGPELLDSYTTERLPHVKEIIETSVVVGQLLCSTDVAASGQTTRCWSADGRWRPPRSRRGRGDVRSGPTVGPAFRASGHVLPALRIGRP